MLIDTHAHLEAIDDLESSLKRAKEAGVGKIITSGTSLDSSSKAIEIASTSLKLRGARENIPEIYATGGIHPREGKDDVKNAGSLHQCINTLKQIASTSDKVVGVGEAGLDYRLTNNPSTSSGQARQLTTDEEKNFQRELFKAQINLAVELNLPLVIHCRNGWKEIFDLLSNVKGQLPVRRSLGEGRSNVAGVFHSWTGDWRAAKKALDLGFYISFSGIVTFKNAPQVQEVAQKTPLERIMVETDSPFLTPEPLRSTSPRLRGASEQNEPKNVKITANFLASLRDQPSEVVAEATTRNAKELFGL
ncbi:TatD family hydrolase [Candidatus Curtissbacteria bacterium]|nr:TatD family hydrolase [Candidatus Curtissbacteria bacterium]